MEKAENLSPEVTEKVTLAVACKALGVSRKTIYSYVEKGLLRLTKEGSRSYIAADDIKALRSEKLSPETVTKVTSKVTPTVTETVTLHKKEYESLIARNAWLEAQSERLIEYKGELQEARERITELEQQLVKKSWWQFWK
jgi:hypothetical protein